MNTLQAYRMALANAGNEAMVFDWDKAAKRIAETHPMRAAAGLQSDWEFTGGLIYQDGKPVKDSYTYLASIWATPELEMDGKVEPCYRMQSEVPGWDEHTKWPKSALTILGAAS